MTEGMMTSTQLRKLIRIYNKREKIPFPKGVKGQADMVKYLSEFGRIDHKKKLFNPNLKRVRQIKLSDYETEFPPKTSEQKAEAKQKATERKGSSEANMVKTLQGKGYTVTKGEASKPAPAAKPASAAKPTGLQPSSGKMDAKEKATFLKDLREQTLKILQDVDLKDTTEEYRKAEDFRKLRMKQKPDAKEEIAQRKKDNGKILERLKLISQVITEKQTGRKKKGNAVKKDSKFDPIEPAQLTLIKKKLKEFVEEAVDELLKEDIRVKGAVAKIKEGYFKIVNKAVPKTSPSLAELDKEWRKYESYVFSEWKKYDKPNEQITKAQTIKKEVADKKAKDASDSGKVSDANFMKRPAFKFLLKKENELYDTIIKLNKQRLAGKLDEKKMEDMIDSLFDRINKESSLQLNTKTKKDDIVFKFGQGTQRTDDLIKLKIKSKIAEANKLKKTKKP